MLRALLETDAAGRVETPEVMFRRVATHVARNDAGTALGQLAACFVLPIDVKRRRERYLIYLSMAP